MLDIFALLVLLLLIAAVIAAVVFLGNLPGNMARAAEHPHADAISLLGWIGLLTLGLGWFVALVWAKLPPPQGTAALEQRVAELEARLGAGEAAE